MFETSTHDGPSPSPCRDAYFRRSHTPHPHSSRQVAAAVGSARRISRGSRRTRGGPPPSRRGPAAPLPSAAAPSGGPSSRPSPCPGTPLPATAPRTPSQGEGCAKVWTVCGGSVFCGVLCRCRVYRATQCLRGKPSRKKTQHVPYVIECRSGSCSLLRNLCAPVWMHPSTHPCTRKHGGKCGIPGIVVQGACRRPRWRCRGR